jgi:arylsulfatase A
MSTDSIYSRLAQIVIVLLTTLSLIPQSPVAGKAPNVVLLLADDLGSKDIGCYGGPVKTPALDKLAANGVRFTDFYSGAPVCSTARATLLTGRHHLRTGIYTVIQDHMHHMHLLKSEVTIAEILQANGYDTVHLGKWHVGTPFRGWKKPWIDEHGFDYWFATDLNAAPSHRNPKNFWRNRERVGELEGYACQLVVDEAIQWLDEKRIPEKPFFLNIWFHEPHAPLAAPDEIVSQYGELTDPAAIYSGTIDNTDRAIARLVKKLEQLGSLDDTIIIYTSDHGSYRQERNGNLRAGKGSLLEGGIRTPGIIFWPNGIEGGRIEKTPAGAVDVLPTLCGLVGVDQPKNVRLDGADLSPLLKTDSNRFNRQQPLTWHSPTSQPVLAIRDGNYSLVGWRNKEYPKDKAAIEDVMNQMKLILEKHHGRKLTRNELWHKCYNSPLNTPDWNKLRGKFVTLNTFQEAWIPIIKAGSGGITRFELYDLSVDPGQTKNIAKQFPDVTKHMQQAALAILADVLREAPLWGPQANSENRSPTAENLPTEKQMQIHRLETKKRSRFDAFAYLNRIPLERESDETPDDLSGRILGRLANQEGRVLVKLPSEMKRDAYQGFKIALDSGQGLHAGNCFSCHQLPKFSLTTSTPPTPSLRNASFSMKQLRQAMMTEPHRNIQLDEGDLNRVLALLQTLNDVPDAEFRNLILNATVLDTSGDLE